MNYRILALSTGRERKGETARRHGLSRSSGEKKRPENATWSKSFLIAAETEKREKGKKKRGGPDPTWLRPMRSDT